MIPLYRTHTDPAPVLQLAPDHLQRPVADTRGVRHALQNLGQAHQHSEVDPRPFVQAAGSIAAVGQGLQDLGRGISDAGSAGGLFGTLRQKVADARDRTALNSVQRLTDSARAAQQDWAAQPANRERPETWAASTEQTLKGLQKNADTILASASPAAQQQARLQLGDFARQFDQESQVGAIKAQLDLARRSELELVFDTARRGDLPQSLAYLARGHQAGLIFDADTEAAATAARDLAHDFHYQQTARGVDAALAQNSLDPNLARSIVKEQPGITDEDRDGFYQRIELATARAQRLDDYRRQIPDQPALVLTALEDTRNQAHLSRQDVDSLRQEAATQFTASHVRFTEKLLADIDLGHLTDPAQIDKNSTVLFSPLARQYLKARQGRGTAADPEAAARLRTWTAALDARQDREQNAGRATAFLTLAIDTGTSGTEQQTLSKQLAARLDGSSPTGPEQAMVAQTFQWLDDLTAAGGLGTASDGSWVTNALLKDDLLKSRAAGQVKGVDGISTWRQKTVAPLLRPLPQPPLLAATGPAPFAPVQAKGSATSTASSTRPPLHLNDTTGPDGSSKPVPGAKSFVTRTYGTRLITLPEVDAMLALPAYAGLPPQERTTALTEALSRTARALAPHWTRETYLAWRGYAESKYRQVTDRKTTMELMGELYDMALDGGRLTARSAIAASFDLSVFNPDGSWRIPFGTVGTQLADNTAKIADTLHVRDLEGRLGIHLPLLQQLDQLRSQIDNGQFPMGDRAALEAWYATSNDTLRELQKTYYQAIEGDTPWDEHYLDANGLYNRQNAALISAYIRTGNPENWKQLRENLLRHPGRAQIEHDQARHLKDSPIVQELSDLMGNDYEQPFMLAGDPINLAATFLPAARLGKLLTATKAGSTAGRAALTTIEATALANLALAAQNPHATWEDYVQNTKQAFAQSLGFTVAGYGLGKTAQGLSAAREGLANAFPEGIRGSKLDQWADSTLAESRQRLNTGLDPTVAAAYGVKAAGLIDNGIREFPAWSEAMLKEYGEPVREHLQPLWSAADHLRQGKPLQVNPQASGDGQGLQANAAAATEPVAAASNAEPKPVQASDASSVHRPPGSPESPASNPTATWITKPHDTTLYPNGYNELDHVDPKPFNPDLKPGGMPKELNPKDKKGHWGTNGENEVAIVAAQHGIEIRQRPETPGETGPNPDYEVRLKGSAPNQWVLAECYSPETSKSLKGIHDVLSRKVAAQAPHIFLRIAENAQNVQDIANYFHRYPIQGMVQLIIVKGNNLYVVH